MMFHEELRKSLDEMNCTHKELAEAGNLPASTVNRYVSGKRVPEQRSEQLEKILDGLQILSNRKKYTGFSRENFYKILEKQLEITSFDYERFRKNLNMLIDTLEIKVSKMTKELYYEPSYIQRIKSGQRRPADPEDFAGKVAAYILEHHIADRTGIRQLLGVEKDKIRNDEEAVKALEEWLCTGEDPLVDPTDIFLRKIDEFDLNECLHKIDKSGESYVTLPFTTRKIYYGKEGMMKAEMNFIRLTLASESMEPSIHYSDMPVENIFGNPEFCNRWIEGLMLLQKKGLKLVVIHNMSRSLHELLLGMEKWIPVYMAGQMESYCLYQSRRNNFCNGIRVSGAVALREGAVRGFDEDSKYYVTEKKEEVAYYNKQIRNLISRSNVLMKVYREENKQEFSRFLLEDQKEQGKRRNILPSLPLYTMSEATLDEIISENYFSSEFIRELKYYYLNQKIRVEDILKHSEMENEVAVQEETNIESCFIPLAGIFGGQELWYAADLYKKHLEETRNFAASHTNYILIENSAPKFRNLQVSIMDENWIMLSKTKNPTIHFVIQEPKLCKTVWKMIEKRKAKESRE